MEQLQALHRNVWIKKCGGPWGNRIVLATKTHQERIQNTDDFIWRKCVYYNKLNGITKHSGFPIPRCGDALSTVSAGWKKVKSSAWMQDKYIIKFQFAVSIEKN